MNTRDYISKLTKLPKNTSTDLSPMKVLVKNNAEGQQKSGIRTPRRAKNFHLAVFDDDSMSPRERSSINSSESSVDEGHISSTVLEVYGREVSTNRTIEEVFKTRQKISLERNKPIVDRWLLSNYQEPEDNVALLMASLDLPNGYEPTKQSHRKSTKPAPDIFPKNILMRSILENNMEFINLTSSSSSTSGKDHDSDYNSSTPDFVEMPDDPDVLFRPELMDKGVLEGEPIDDGYRFAHHGVKKTITPRRYLMDSIDDDDFLFKKNCDNI